MQNLRLSVFLTAVAPLFVASCSTESGIVEAGTDNPAERPTGGSPDGSGDGSDEEMDGGDDPVDLDFESDGGAERCSVEALVTPEVYTRRLKTLLTGAALTDDELVSVLDDASNLRGLVADWIETDGFREKTIEFLTQTLQTTADDIDPYAAQISQPGGLLTVRSAFLDAMQESMARTAWWIIEEGRPFNEIASTNTFMMTTSLLSFLLAADNPVQLSPTFYHKPPEERDADERLTYRQNGQLVDFDADTPLHIQIREGTFYSQIEFDNAKRFAVNNLRCTDPWKEPQAVQDRLYSLFMEGQDSIICQDRDSPMVDQIRGLYTRRIQVDVFNPDLHTDWRLVTLVQATEDNPALPYYDGVTLRNATQLAMRTPRAGFFSHPAFLATWPTNIDNSFRVTTNQMLIVGLNLAFEDTDVSTPLGDEGLSQSHADPTTACYSCHKNLDPMRNFFANVYDPETYFARDPSLETNQPSFSFNGHSGFGDSLTDLGLILADHPFFATAWTQKLCLYGKADKCNERDPEFKRIVSAFSQSNFDYKTLVTELFSSPIMTGADCVTGDETDSITASITRAEHFCGSIESRMGVDGGLCVRPQVASLVGALPATSWSRGADRPNQTTDSSLFYSATTDALCREIWNSRFNLTPRPTMLNEQNPEAAIDSMVTDLMGLPPSDARHTRVREWLWDHFEENRSTGTDAFRSSFLLACSSPFVISTDF